MATRATPLSADERRKSIVAALIPLLVEHGGDVTTAAIAQAAGVAEGTIFRVFSDKHELMLAAAQEAINPAGSDALWEKLLAHPGDLRARTVYIVRQLAERTALSMAVLTAIHSHLRTDPHHGVAKRPVSREFMRDAQTNLHRNLTALFAPHRAELAVDPEVAAMALRSIVFGVSHPGLALAPTMTAEQTADLVLNGVLKRDD